MMKLVDMQGLKPCPLWVLVQVQVRVHIYVNHLFYSFLSVAFFFFTIGNSNLILIFYTKFYNFNWLCNSGISIFGLNFFNS